MTMQTFKNLQKTIASKARVASMVLLFIFGSMLGQLASSSPARAYYSGTATNASVIILNNSFPPYGASVSGGTLRLSFQAVQSIPSNARINVYFPLDFDISGVVTGLNGGGSCSSQTGPFTTIVTNVSYQKSVTITRTGGFSITAGSQQTCDIVGITNPPTIGTTGTFRIGSSTQISGTWSWVDQAIVPGLQISGALTAANVQPATLMTGASGTATITFTTYSAIPNTGKMKVTFPSGFDVSAASGGACSSMDGSFATSVSGQVVTLTRSGGSSEPAGAQSCTINNITNPIPSGSTGEYVLATTNSADTVIDSNPAVPADTILPAPLTSTNVQPASLYAGASGTATVSFTTATAIPNTGKIKVTFPSGYNVAGATGATCSTMDGSFSTSVSGQIVTITRSAGSAEAAGAQTCTINTIINPPISGSTGVYDITTTNASNITINTDAAVAADTMIPGILTSTNVQPATLSAGVSGIATATFTTANPIASTGKIKVTFGSGFNVSGASGATCSSMDGAFTTSVSGQTVTITRSAGSSEPAGAQTCTISGIVNPAASGSTGVYGITTTNATDVSIDTDAAVAADTITGVLTSTDVQPAVLSAGASGTATVTFTTVNVIPTTGKIKVTFPSGYNVSGAAGATCSSMDGSFATAISGQIVTITRSAGSSEPIGPQTCTINTVVNPSVPGSTGVYEIRTTDAADAILDIDSAVTADTITSSILTATNVQPVTLVAGAVGMATITFTNTNPIPSTGKIKVTFPSGFNVAGASSGVCSSMDGSFSTSVSGQVVTIARSGGTSRISGSQTCTINLIANPTVSGSTGVYNITTATAGDVAIDIDAVVSADTITAGVLTSTNVEPQTLYANASGMATVTFTTANPIPSTGKIKVTFGAGYNVASAAGATCSGMDGSFSASVSGQIVTITRSAGTARPVGPQTCTIGTIVNQTTTGTTGVYGISTTNATDAVIDTNATVSADTIVTGVLTSTNVEPATLYVSASGMTTVTFTTINAIPSTGKIKVTFGAGYNVAGASGGTCSTMDGSFSTSVSGQIVTITRSAGTSKAAGIQSCTMNTIVNQTTPGSTGVYGISTTTAGDNTIDTNAAVSADTIVTGVLTSTNVAPATLYVSASGMTTVTFTTANLIPSTGKIKVTFGAGFDVSGAAGGTCSTMDGSFSTSVSGQIVTITRSTGTSEPIGPQTCTINTIVNQATPGSTGVYAITTSIATDEVIDTNAAVSVDTIVTGVLTSTNVEPYILDTGASVTTTITFTTANPISSTGKIKVTYGSGFNVSGATGGTCSTMDGSFSTSVSGQTVTLTRSGGSSEPIGIQNCTIFNIVNPAVSGSTGVYAIETTTAANNTVDIDSAVPADTITPGALSGTDVEPSSLYVSASGMTTILFTTNNPIPSDGKLKVTFGAGFNVAGASGGTCSSMDGSFSTSVSGQTVTLTRSGGSSEPAGIQNCTINTIINQSTPGTTGVYDITTTSAADAMIETNPAVNADTIVTGVLTSTNVEPATLYVSASGMTTVRFTTVNVIPMTGKIKVTFGAGFNVAGAAGATCSTMDGSFSTSISGQTVTITRSVGSAEPAGPQICTINTIVNQTTPGSTGVYGITTSDASDNIIDTKATVTADTIVTGVLTSADVEPETLYAGASGTSTITFTTANPISSTGKIKVTFGSGFNVTSASGGTCSTMDGSFSTSVSGQIVTLTRSGGTSEPIGPQICTIDTVVNPSSTGSTGVYGIETTTAANLTIDANASVSADTITTGVLTSTNVEPETLFASSTGTTTITFTNVNSIPSTGKIKVTFGAGYNVAGATGGTCSTMNGSFSTSVSGQIVTLTRSGGTATSAGPQTCTVDAIVNQSSPGTTGIYGIMTTTAANITIDSNPAVSADSIAAMPGITVSAISGNTTEAGGTATYTIVLDSIPTADVTIDISSIDTTEGTVSTSSVMFTSVTWDIPVTITVTGVDDVFADGPIVYSIINGPVTSADLNYNGLDPNDVTLTNTDNDTAGFTVSTISGNTSESGATSTYTIVLTSQPTSDVTIGVSSSDLTEGTVSTSSIVFTSSNWNAPVTVTVTGVDDLVADGPITYSIINAAAVSADLGYNGLNPADVSVTNTDNDSAGITVSAISGNTTESGGTADYTIVLSTQPTADVTIAVSSSDLTEGTVSTSSIVFTSSSWNVPVTVTVTGVNDAITDGNIVYSMINATAVSADPSYSGLDPADVSVTNMDIGTPGITVSAISGNTTEAGGTATYTIVLTSAPTADVTIGVASLDTTEGTVSTSSIVFTSVDWSIPVTVTVTGVDDSVTDGDVVFTIQNAAAVSSDVNYSGLNPADVTVTNTDNETAGFTVSAISGNTTEAGGTATYTIVLNAEPTDSVTIAISSSDVTEGTVSTSSVLFTPFDWNVPVTITVTGVDDSVVDGNIVYSVLNAAADSMDVRYGNLDPGDVSITNTDNDTSSGGGGGGGGGGGSIPVTTPAFQYYYNGRYLTQAEYDLLFPPTVASSTAVVAQGTAPESSPCLSSASSSETVLNPSILTTDQLVAALCVSRKTPAQEDLVSEQVKADAKEFGLTLNDKLVVAIRNFIVYGISYHTIQFGQGERRAIARDYMDTVNFPYVTWTDIARMAKGQIPINRNLVRERSQVIKVLPVFEKIFGHRPNFNNAKENLSWNTLMYRIRFTRDMVKEAKGISIYYGIYGHNPLSPFSWSLVRVLGYVK